uniref:Envelope polyprotein n=1 Tax=Fundulus heteroclitus TaxID=8078 RepID=A0A3Q2SRJ2_FUNHE
MTHHATLQFFLPDPSQYFNMRDISNALFSVPVDKTSQFWFAFTFKGQIYTYTRLPQGYCESSGGWPVGEGTLTRGPKTDSEMKPLILNSHLTTNEWFQVTTGVSGQTNNWLLMVEQAANMSGQSCVVCMGPRPLLQVVPAVMDAECLLEVMNKTVPITNCSQWEKIYPLAIAQKQKPLFSNKIAPSNFTCINMTNTGQKFGNLTSTWCKTIVTVSRHFSPVSRADVWWWCGDDRLFDKLPRNVSGTCGLVSLLLPVKVYPMTVTELMMHVARALPQKWSFRAKRDISWQAAGNPTYIDALGVPRGVPDEYKLVNQVGSGIVSVFCSWCTVNTNVARINYIHYNVQRLGNWTQSGFEAVHEQLAATSLMAFQNRIALDMLLAEKGGVCAIFGEECCTFIPNNTASNGSLTVAIEGLRSLNGKMEEHSGVDRSMWDSWLDVFGNYRTLISSVLVCTAVFAAILTLCGCCCIPWLRGLTQQLITTAIAPPQEQYPIFAPSDYTDNKKKKPIKETVFVDQV